MRDKGQALTRLVGAIQETAKGSAGSSGASLDRERELLSTALEDAQAIIGTMVGHLTSAAEDRGNVYKVGLNSTRLVHVLGDLVVGWLLIRQAEVASAALANGASGRDKSFYEGKVAVAGFFARTVLPELTARRAIAEGVNSEVMELAEAAF